MRVEVTGERVRVEVAGEGGNWRWVGEETLPSLFITCWRSALLVT